MVLLWSPDVAYHADSCLTAPTQNPGQAVITQGPTASIYLGVHVHFTCPKVSQSASGSTSGLVN